MLSATQRIVLALTRPSQPAVRPIGRTLPPLALGFGQQVEKPLLLTADESWRRLGVHLDGFIRHFAIELVSFADRHQVDVH